MKKICLILAFVLVMLSLLSCAHRNRYRYDENGEFRIENGDLPEELPKPSDLIWRAPAGGFVSLQDYLDHTPTTTGYVVFRAKKVTSESLSTKDSSLEYTITKLEILEVYESGGEQYKDLVQGGTIDIIENYTFVPDGDRLTFKKVEIVGLYPDQDQRFSISDGRGYEYVQPGKEYIVILLNEFPDRKMQIASGESGECIVSEDQINSIFVPDVIQAIDEQRYTEMLTQEEYTMPVEERPKRRPLALYDYFYFDILNQYVFNEK